MIRSMGRHGTLAARLHRLERGVEASDCTVCGGVLLLVAQTAEEVNRLLDGGCCRGCGAPMKVLKGIDVDAI